MFSVKVKIEDRAAKVKQAVEKSAFRNLDHAAASLRKDVRSTIKRAPKAERIGSKSRGGKRVRRARHAASPAGTPPYTQRGQLSNAIVYDIAPNKRSAVIGPRKSVVGESAAAHEFGGSFKGQQYPERPFMGPGLTRAIPRFAGSFAGSIGE